jgi:hypothetical protein
MSATKCEDNSDCKEDRKQCDKVKHECVDIPCEDNRDCKKDQKICDTVKHKCVDLEWYESLWFIVPISVVSLIVVVGLITYYLRRNKGCMKDTACSKGMYCDIPKHQCFKLKKKLKI